jgi:hypothetical protein
VISAEIGREHFDTRIGSARRTCRTVSAKWTRSAVVEIVAIDAGDDDITQAIAAAMRATLAGSSGSRRISCLDGDPFGTEQNPHPRVQRFPRIMKVAAPRLKHS